MSGKLWRNHKWNLIKVNNLNTDRRILSIIFTKLMKNYHKKLKVFDFHRIL